MSKKIAPVMDDRRPLGITLLGRISLITGILLLSIALMALLWSDYQLVVAGSLDSLEALTGINLIDLLVSVDVLGIWGFNLEKVTFLVGISSLSGAILHLVLGLGQLKLKSWAWWLSVLVYIFTLPTIYAALFLWYYLTDEAKMAHGVV
jgi:hypothetical protein